MTQTTINNGDSGLTVRTALNDMIDELYDGVADLATQLASYQPLSAQLSAVAGASWSSGTQIISLTGANTVSLLTVGAATGNILDKAAGDSLYTNASNIVSGTLSDSRLSATVALLNATNTWSNAQSFSADITIDNSIYLKSKINAGTTTRILGINSSDAMFIGSIDAAIASMSFTSNGASWASLTSTGFSAGKYTSTVTTGTAPLTVASTTVVTNLNSDLLDGQEGSFYQSASNLNAGIVPSARMPAFSGDVTTSAGGVTTTLATVNSNVGSFGSTSTIPVITVNGKGLITAVSTASLGTAAVKNTGTSGNTVPLLDGANTWSTTQTFADGTFTGLGIGATPSTGMKFRIGGNLTGATTSYSASVDTTVQSDVTAAAMGFRTSLGTAASAFTLSTMYHYLADQGTIGAGSTLTSQYGFAVGSTLTGATNNYGFYGNIASGTNRWNLYMNGTANNYIAGALGIGSTSLTGYNLRIGKTITGSTISRGISVDSVVQSDVTSAAYIFDSAPGTAASSFTLATLYHYRVAQGTVGAGSTVGTQVGFMVESSVTGATNNYGFYGNIASGTNRYNLYMGGTADNYLAGSLGIGGPPSTGYVIQISKAITGATSARTVAIESTIQSDVTSDGMGFVSQLSTQAASFTMTRLTHFRAHQATIGAGSTVTNQYGFKAESSIVGATNNYGFYGDIASGTNRYNLYMNGTALNYLAGATGIGVVPLTASNARLGIAGATVVGASGPTFAQGIYNTMQVASTITSDFITYGSAPSTAASAFTLGNMFHYYVSPGSIGAGSAITNQYGYYVANTMTGATNNYAFYSAVGLGTNRWNLYMFGTADNYIAGRVGIGTAPTYHLDISGQARSTGIFITTLPAPSGTPTGTPSGTGGTLAAATYYFKIVAVDQFGCLTTASTESAGVTTTGTTSSIALAWGYVAGAVTYRIYYGTSSNGQAAYYTTTNNTNTYTFTATSGTAGTVPTTNNTGGLAIGSIASEYGITVGKNITGNSNSGGINVLGTVQSDVTTSAYLYTTNAATVASSFTLSQLIHYRASTSSLGAGSVVTTQVGYFARGTLNGATTNIAFQAADTGIATGKTSYGFKSEIGVGTGGTAWNFYADGAANNYMAGSLGIGQTSLTARRLAVSGSITGNAVNAYGVIMDATIASDAVGNVRGIYSVASTAAASFTVTNLYHFAADQGTIGAGSAITSQYGFTVGNMTGATNNYGFYGNIAAGTNRYNLYMFGTADNYLAGNTGVGTTPQAGVKFRVGGNATGAVYAYGIYNSTTIQSDVTTRHIAYTSYQATAVAAFTLPTLTHFQAEQAGIGAGSTVTNQYGFFADGSLTGGTNNYGFYSNITAGSNRWNFYAAGTAANYFAGDMRFDKTVTTGGTTGAQTINKNAGSVNFAAAATSLVVTNSLVTTSSIIIATVATNDGTMKSVQVVAGSGSFTLYANAAATAETRVNFIVIN